MSDVPATMADMSLPVGLEDFDITDAGVPYLNILHKEGVFEDSLSKARYESLANVIVLGLIKGRTLWPAQMNDDDTPLCRSFDSKVGRPDTQKFPWQASGFTQDVLTKDPANPEQWLADCETCPLQAWDSHPTREAPWCSLQNTLAILIPEDDGEGGIVFVMALLRLQRSSLRPSNAFLGSFARRKKATFTSYATLSLDQRHRGSNPYCVIKIEQGGPTEQTFWEDYAAQYLAAREYIQTPRTFAEEEGTPVDPPGPAASAAAPAASTAAGPAPTAAPAAPTGPGAPPEASPSPAPTAPVAPAASAPVSEPTPASSTSAEAPAAPPAAPAEAPVASAPPAAAPAPPAAPPAAAPPLPTAAPPVPAAAPPTAPAPVAPVAAVAPAQADNSHPAGGEEEELPF